MGGLSFRTQTPLLWSISMPILAILVLISYRSDMSLKFVHIACAMVGAAMYIFSLILQFVLRNRKQCRNERTKCEKSIGHDIQKNSVPIDNFKTTKAMKA